LGTIYRAATGDVVPEPLGVGGSVLVSGLLSGPIGLFVNIAVTMAEKVTGIDPEKVVVSFGHLQWLAHPPTRHRAHLSPRRCRSYQPAKRIPYPDREKTSNIKYLL
jgi:hypothetical protein